jgi:hypothetical protein
MINRIAVLGSLFKHITVFLERHGGLGTKLAIQLAYGRHSRSVSDEDENMNGMEEEDDGLSEGEEVTGVYVKAFCQGV